ncbi:DUF6894 family protein [Muricoccus aerilatus]|uniref:DUF6894 family protein n=1 Tax=Muricoccus aerilatus TaxID=452982 RepID=UPI0005C1B61B|nr:hypothetical protein [Roseomonas aerilata]
MPRYFFDVDDGISLPDLTGTDLPGLNEAYIQAIKTAGQMLQGAGMDLLTGTPWQMEVTDERGQLLLTLHFSAEIARKTLAA